MGNRSRSEGADELTAAFTALFTAFPGIFTADRVWLAGEPLSFAG